MHVQGDGYFALDAPSWLKEIDVEGEKLWVPQFFLSNNWSFDRTAPSQTVNLWCVDLFGLSKKCKLVDVEELAPVREKCFLNSEGLMRVDSWR